MNGVRRMLNGDPREIPSRNPGQVVSPDSLQSIRLAKRQATCKNRPFIESLRAVARAEDTCGMESFWMDVRFGIRTLRMVLGAHPGRVLWQVLARELKLVAVGIVLGVIRRLNGVRLAAPWEPIALI